MRTYEALSVKILKNIYSTKYIQPSIFNEVYSAKCIQPTFAESWKFSDDRAAPFEVFGTTKAEEETKTFLVGARKEILPQTGGDAENQTRSSTDYSRNFSVSEEMQLCSRSS